MKTLVEIIAEVEENLKELQEAAKKNGKALAALEEERNDIVAGIARFNKVLEDLTRIKETECNEIMEEKKPGNCMKPAKKIIVIDEKGEKIAEYDSQNKAAKDLGITQSVLSTRMKKRTKEQQIRSFGFAAMFA